MVESDGSSQAGLLHHVEIYCTDLQVTTDFWDGSWDYSDTPSTRIGRVGGVIALGRHISCLCRPNNGSAVRRIIAVILGSTISRSMPLRGSR